MQQQDRKSEPVKLELAKRSSKPTPEQIEQNWAIFDQMRIFPHHTIDTDALPHSATKLKSLKDPPPCSCIPQPSKTPTVKDTVEEPTPIPTDAPSNITRCKDEINDT